jgi:hypothetical protein
MASQGVEEPKAKASKVIPTVVNPNLERNHLDTDTETTDTDTNTDLSKACLK